MIRLRPAQLSSLAEALSDDGAVEQWRRGGVKLAARHFALGDVWQVEVEFQGDFQVVAVGGFHFREDLKSAEAWFRATVWTGRKLREAVQGVVMVLLAARRRYGAVCAAVRIGSARSERLVSLMCFVPSGYVDGDHRFWRFEPEGTL